MGLITKIIHYPMILIITHPYPSNWLLLVKVYSNLVLCGGGGCTNISIAPSLLFYLSMKNFYILQFLHLLVFQSFINYWYLAKKLFLFFFNLYTFPFPLSLLAIFSSFDASFFFISYLSSSSPLSLPISPYVGLLESVTDFSSGVRLGKYTLIQNRKS